MQNFLKIKPLRNGKIFLSCTDVGKLCLSHESLESQISLLMLFEEIKFSQKFLNLQYEYG